ncbi:MAG TPA: alpha/beta fold hydrolase [Ktedonobacterales bacterium]|jgi:pimeloyl-ACP methyl ester carboxylesterase
MDQAKHTVPQEPTEASSSHAAATPGRTPLLRRRLPRYLLLALALLILVWGFIPAVRAFTLIANFSHRSAPLAPTDLPVQSVHFRASDGVALAGWFVPTSPTAPTVILVHGFKGSRADMLPWARFLAGAGYNVLLFDSRGCGESAGWAITDGARDPSDIVGAVAYLQQRADLPSKRFGALGVSMGAGAVLLAAAREPGLLATVADSAWADQSVQIHRMDSLSLPFFSLPLLPYGPALVDALIGAHLADARPLAAISQIAPRAVMLIHSADDENTTTPLSGERQLYAAAGQPKEQWIAPSGGHAGALHAHTAEYEQRVLAFFAMYLRPAA